MWKGLPMACRARPPWTRADLLAATAAVALVVGVLLAFAATDLSLVGDFPLWNAVLVVCALAALTLVVSFPDWWAWTGDWETTRGGCGGARQRRASHTVDLLQARAPRARQRPDRPDAHRIARPVGAGQLARSTHRVQVDVPLAMRRRDCTPRLQRPHGRQRG